MRRLRSVMLLSLALWLGACQTVPEGGDEVVEAYGRKDYVGVLALTRPRVEAGTASRTERVLQAWSWFQIDHLERARREFAALREENASDVHPWLGEAWIRIEYRQFDRVPALLDEAERWMEQHQRPMVYAARGWLAFHLGRLDEAARWFDRTEQALYFEDAEYISIPSGIMQTWNTLPWVGRGWIALARGRQDEAEAAFRRGLAHDASCHLCHAGLAALAEARGDADAALEAAIAGLRVSRHDPALVIVLNRLLAARKDLRLSERVYRDLVQRSNGDPLYLANLGYVHLYMGRFEAAREAFERALRDEPGQWLASRGLEEVRPLLAEQARLRARGR